MWTNLIASIKLFLKDVQKEKLKGYISTLYYLNLNSRPEIQTLNFEKTQEFMSII